MNVGAQGENYGQFCYIIGSHSRVTVNQHLHYSEEGKQDTKEDKGNSMMHAL